MLAKIRFTISKFFKIFIGSTNLRVRALSSPQTGRYWLYLHQPMNAHHRVTLTTGDSRHHLHPRVCIVWSVVYKIQYIYIYTYVCMYIYNINICSQPIGQTCWGQVGVIGLRLHPCYQHIIHIIIIISFY